MDALIELMITEKLREAFRTYGVEGAEQTIKDVYSLTPVLRDKYLEVYRRLINDKK